MASNVASEGTAAAENAIGELRRDPFAMLPFCGYHMGDYFTHWLSMTGRTSEANLPRIYGVNWFRKDADGKFLWPGFGENSRVLAWVFRRCDGEAQANETAIGYVPDVEHLELNGLDHARVAEALRVGREDWQGALDELGQFYQTFGDRLPRPIWDAHARTLKRL